MGIRPTYERERAAGKVVAGVDECGRGCLAGEVWAAAVVIPDWAAGGVSAVADSKILAAAKREQLCEMLRTSCHAAIGTASLEEIEHLNILQATMLAMSRAVAALPVRPDHVLVDGNRVPKGLPCAATAVVGGDATVRAIAAASIVAKVGRDAAMASLHLAYPAYGWDRNAGYGTPEHLAAIRTHGPSPHHRRTFAGVREHLVLGAAAPFRTDAAAFQDALAV